MIWLAPLRLPQLIIHTSYFLPNKPSFRPERARNERAEWRNLLQNASSLGQTVRRSSRFLDFATLRVNFEF
jgi:hypothetical protein